MTQQFGSTKVATPVEALSASDDSFTTELYQILRERFNLEELRTLCFELRVEYDDLPGEGRAAKARELVRFMQRTDQLDYLWATIQQNRPDIR